MVDGRPSVAWRSALLSIARLIVGAAVPVGVLLVGHLVYRPELRGGSLVVVWFFTIVFIGASVLASPRKLFGRRYAWPFCPAFLTMLVLGLVLYGVLVSRELGGWLLLVGSYVILFGTDAIVSRDAGSLRKQLIHVCFGLVAGVLPVALSQIEGNFAEEEFFCAVQVAILAAYWYVTRFVTQWLGDRLPRSETRGIVVHRNVVGLLSVWMAFAGGLFLIRSYQRSFFSDTVPVYPGISTATPFLCGSVEQDPLGVDGLEVHHRLLTSIAHNPNKSTLEYGMLALGLQSWEWAAAFRDALLTEADQQRFAGPANSVKYQQYLASQRLYYFLVVQRVFPQLFTDNDRVMLDGWFSSINVRALTVEWVDWMYGLAFTKWPEGPYENQESGSALLSLIEYSGLGDDELSRRNQDYLSRGSQGWATRFANTDDAFVYQPEWITNAFLQSLYFGKGDETNVRDSFEWMLLQLLPGGEPLGYNHVGVAQMAGSLYLGAVLLEDPRYIWLANQALDALEASGRYARAQVGAEYPVDLTGQAPEQGSCLIYGDSGLPNQVGPLAPDKVVLRSGWKPNDTYVLLNLRFTGWHRYKATNTISLVYAGESISQEYLGGESFSWLPEGRSLFRDKRIPRENLNGLVVERSGMSAVVSCLTGWGGEWAQDPPHYAELVVFEPGDVADMVRARLVDWRGWTHDRTVRLYHDRGPVVIVDEAIGPSMRDSMLVWHFPPDASVNGQSLVLQTEGESVAVRFVCLSEDEPCSFSADREADRVRVAARGEGSWRVATVFLFGEWVGGDLLYDSLRGELTVVGPERDLRMSLKTDGPGIDEP